MVTKTLVASIVLCGVLNLFCLTQLLLQNTHVTWALGSSETGYSFLNEVEAAWVLWQYGKFTAPSGGLAWQLQLIQGVLMVSSIRGTFPVPTSKTTVQVSFLCKHSLRCGRVGEVWMAASSIFWGHLSDDISVPVWMIGSCGWYFFLFCSSNNSKPMLGHLFVFINGHTIDQNIDSNIDTKEKLEMEG